MVDDLCGRTLGEFVLREKLAEGGCGTLYRCSQPSLQRDAVVKVLRKRRRGNEEAEQRFLREAQLASRLDHAYAAHVYAFGVEPEDGLRWIAMELVPGITLDEWLLKHGPMSLELLVPLLECLAEVLHAAHSRGIVHRDVKAANVMVIENGGRLIPKLLDFGIAKMSGEVDSPAPKNWPDGSIDSAIDQNREPASEQLATDAVTSTDPILKDRHLTPSGAGFGSWWYMSPEQWGDARSVGPASDIYSLGVLAYKALTGRVPFDSENERECYRQHLNADVPLLGGDFPPGLDRIFQRALAKTPDARHRTAPELVSELRAALMASERELLRSLARQWEARARAPGLLLGRDVLADVERWTRRAPPGLLTKLECSYVAASQRRARRAALIRRLLVAGAIAIAAGAFVYRWELRARMAEELVTQAEVERGQQALLHGESSEAVLHLEKAYQRGDHSPGVAFMLARSLQPRMAELGRLTSSSGRMWTAVFSPDGKRILTTDDKSARMWDAGSNQLLFEMQHGDIVYQAMFSPSGDRIITASGDGTVRIWNAVTGALVQVLRWSGAQQWRYSAIAISTHLVAAIDMMGKIAHVWDADKGVQIAELDNDAPGLALLAFSSDGRSLASSGRDEVRVFDTSTWQRTATISVPRVRSLSFAPTSSRIAIGTYDGNASIWEARSGMRVRCLREAGESVDAVSFSPDGTLLVTGSRDGAEQIWDTSSGGLRTQFNSHHSKIYSLEFAAADNLLLSAGADGAATISNVATGMPVARLEGPKSLIWTAHFDLESRRVVGASWDGTARVWDANSPYRRWASPSIGPECDTMDNLEPDQRFVAVSCRNHGTHVWDTARGEAIAELPEVTTAEGGFDSAFPALTSTGDRIAIARVNMVEVYALPSGQLLRKITHPGAVNTVAFAPTGHDLISGAVDGSLLLTRDDREPLALPTSTNGVDAAAILADGRVIVADASTQLRVIDPDHNALLMNLVAPSRVRLLRPSPDGTRLVTISVRSKQAAPALWDLKNRRLIAQLDGHVGRVFTARFVANGLEFLTAGADGTARLWNAATGSLSRTFVGDSHFLADATLAPDGAVVVAGGSDGLLRFWDVSTGRLLWMLQAHKSYVIGVHYEGAEIVTRGFAGDISRWRLPEPHSLINACDASTCAAAALAEQ